MYMYLYVSMSCDHLRKTNLPTVLTILPLLSQVNNTVQRLAADKGELLQQHADEVDQYERRIRSLTEEVS